MSVSNRNDYNLPNAFAVIYYPSRCSIDPICCIQIHQQSKEQDNTYTPSIGNRCIFRVFVFKTGIYQYLFNESIKISFEIHTEMLSVHISIAETSTSFIYGTVDISNQYCAKTYYNYKSPEIKDKLTSFVSSSTKNLNLEQIHRCFIDNNIDFTYFINHERKEFVDLMRIECGFKVATAMKLWKHFVVNITTIYRQNGVQNGVYYVMDELSNDTSCSYFMESKVVSFIYKTKTFIHLNQMRQCLMDQNRNDFLFLIHKECRLSTALSMRLIKLWNYFVYIQRSNIECIELNLTDIDDLVSQQYTESMDDTHDINRTQRFESEVSANDDFDDKEMEFGEALSTPWDDDEPSLENDKYPKPNDVALNGYVLSTVITMDAYYHVYFPYLLHRMHEVFVCFQYLCNIHLNDPKHDRV